MCSRAACLFVLRGLAVGLLPLATGCHAVMLNVDDVIVSRAAAAHGGPHRSLAGAAQHGAAQLVATPAPAATAIELSAHLEQRVSLLTVGRLTGVPIEFVRDGQVIGTAETDAQGRAVLACAGGPSSWHYLARASVPGGKLTSEGQVFVWAANRPAIVIDLDETLLQSRYVDMMLFIHDPSPPLDHAHAVLHRLARDYGIIYISARARLFRNMTQSWLRRHNFPPGPIVHCDDFSAVFRQEEAKREMVRELKRHVNVVAGIGDKSFDEFAFRDNDILTIIIRHAYRARRPETLVLSSWSEVPAALIRRAPPALPVNTGFTASAHAARTN